MHSALQCDLDTDAGAACRAGMTLFYIIDAVAIYAVLKQHPHDTDAAVCSQEL